MLLDGPGHRRERGIEEDDDDEIVIETEHSPIKYTLVVPAIVCDSCVKTLKFLLSDFALNKATNFIFGSVETKKITITTNPNVAVEKLLDCIIDAGYDSPLPYEFKEDSKKRQKGAEHGFLTADNFNPGNIVAKNTGVPIVHHFRITTSRTNACLDGIVEQFKGLNLQSAHNGEGVVAVEVDSSVAGEQLEQAIYSMTGHSSTPVSSEKKFKFNQ